MLLTNAMDFICCLQPTYVASVGRVYPAWRRPRVQFAFELCSLHRDFLQVSPTSQDCRKVRWASDGLDGCMRCAGRKRSFDLRMWLLG